MHSEKRYILKPEFGGLQLLNVLDKVGRFILRKPVSQLEELSPPYLEEIFSISLSLCLLIFSHSLYFLSLLQLFLRFLSQ